MTQNQKTIALISFVLLVAGGVGYFYFKKSNTPIEGVDEEDIAQLKQIEIV
jgi:hypothetical protein